MPTLLDDIAQRQHEDLLVAIFNGRVKISCRLFRIL